MSEELHASVKQLLKRPVDEREQELLRASFTRARLTEAERTIARATVLKETALRNLDAALNDGNAEQAHLETQHLADALALMGDYEQAAQLHPITEERSRLRAIESAIDRDDTKLCDCKPTKAKLNGVDIEVPTTHISHMVFSERHGRMVGLEVCDRCNEANARPVADAQPTPRPDTEVLKVRNG